MIDEGAAFHNCLSSLSESAASGRSRFFVIRDAMTRRRIAVACVSWQAKRSTWVLGNIKGPANIDPCQAVVEFGLALAMEYGRVAAHLPSPEGEAVDDPLEGFPSAVDVAAVRQLGCSYPFRVAATARPVIE